MGTVITQAYTPVRTPRGAAVHALAWDQIKTACGKAQPKAGWRVTDAHLSCAGCMTALAAVAKRPARRARPEARP